MTSRRRRFRLPDTGKWHDNLDDIEPDARPQRDPQPPPGSRRAGRRKNAVARRSRAPIAPHGGYYYWCAHCDYCNKPEEGRKARCAHHEREDARVRKARQRHDAATRTMDGNYIVTADQLATLQARTGRLRPALDAYERALHVGNSGQQKRELLQAINAVRAAVSDLPKPDRGR